MAVLHQGFPATATAPTVRAVTTLLAAGRAHPDTLDGLIEFLGGVATSVTSLSEDGFFAELLPEVAAAIAEAYPVVLPALTLRASALERGALVGHSRPGEALFLAENLVAMARTPLLVDRREELAELVAALRAEAGDSRLRASEAADLRLGASEAGDLRSGASEAGDLRLEGSMVEASGRGGSEADSSRPAGGSQPDWVRLLASLGVDVRADLRDPDPAVRLRAALARESDLASREIILAALPHPPPPGTHRAELVAAAIRVAADFTEIAGAACAVVARASWTGADDEWGALVRYAFAPPRQDRLTDDQRALLRALAANPNLWDPKNGTVGLVYRAAGLPFNRDACRRLAGRRESGTGSVPSVCTLR